jgi:magnesium-protoporphyrin O-methyltransferase
VDCCDPNGYERVFSDRFARRLSRRYRRRGLGPVEQQIVDFCADRGLQGATVLEIGGGVGELHLELLRRGAARATNLELVDSYDEQAHALAESAGLADRVHRRLLDIAVNPDEVEPADVVVLHRVVCCYPDYQRLLGAAADHTRRLLVFSHPPRNLLTRTLAVFENGWRRLQGTGLRAFTHSPEAMVEVARSRGLDLTYRQSDGLWRVAGLERAEA